MYKSVIKKNPLGPHHSKIMTVPSLIYFHLVFISITYYLYMAKTMCLNLVCIKCLIMSYFPHIINFFIECLM